MAEISEEEAEEEVNENDVEEFSKISSFQFREYLDFMKRYAMQKFSQINMIFREMWRNV